MTRIKKKHLIVIGSLATGLLIIVGAVVIQHFRHPSYVAARQHTVSHGELAAADGKNGHSCYVAIDNTVYQITDSAFWQNGQHTPSDGRAYCGADLSKVIDQAPHGRKVLDTLTVVGPLQN